MCMARVGLLIILIFTACNYQQKAEQTKPRISDITESVYASVTVRPNTTYYPQSARSALIEEIFIKEGELVKKGDVLCRLSVSADIDNRLTQAELNLEEAKSNYLGKNNLLRNIETELASVRQQLALDSTNLARQERLWKQNIGKKVDYDRASRTYQATLSQLKVLQYTRSQSLTNLENNYKKARSLVKTEREQLADFQILAKMDGKVYRVHKEIGELISPQEQLAEIGSAEDFVLEMDIDEVDITKIAIGDTVIIALEAYPNEVFPAQLASIAPKKDELTQTFRVESQFLQKPPKLYNGLSGEANIVTDTRKNALIIPTAYLLDGNRVLTQGGETEVKVGVKNMEFVEILAGIDTSTVVLKPGQ